MFFRFCVYCNTNTLWTFVKQILAKGKDTGWDSYKCTQCSKMSFMQFRKVTK